MDTGLVTANTGDCPDSGKVTTICEEVEMNKDSSTVGETDRHSSLSDSLQGNGDSNAKESDGINATEQDWTM